MRYQDDWPTQNGGTPRVMTTPFSTRTVRVLVEKCYTKHSGPELWRMLPPNPRWPRSKSYARRRVGVEDCADVRHRLTHPNQLEPKQPGNVIADGCQKMHVRMSDLCFFSTLCLGAFPTPQRACTVLDNAPKAAPTLSPPTRQRTGN